MNTLSKAHRVTLMLIAAILLAGLAGCQPEGFVYDPQSGRWVLPESPLQTPTPESTELPTLTPLPTLPPEPTRSGTPVIKGGPTLTPSPTRPPLLLTPTPVGSPPANLQALYYVADNNGTPELRLIGIDDQGRKWLESNVATNQLPVGGYGLYPSPDGKYLAMEVAYGGLHILERSSGRVWCPFDMAGECQGHFGGWMLDDRLLLRPSGGPPTGVVPGGALVMNIYTGQYEQLDLPIQPQWGYSLVQQVSLSPDRSRLVYSITYPENGREFSEIWTMRLDTKDKQLVRRMEGVINTLSWSPVGEQLIYLYQPGTRTAATDSSELWLSNSDGTGAKLIANNTRDAGSRSYGPIWSSDGRHIAFVQVDDLALFLSDWREPGTNVYVADTVTGQITQLSAFKGRNSSFPIWSPDGRFVAFVSSIIIGEPEYGAVPTWVEVWIASADGSQLHAVSGTARWASALAWLPPISSTQEK